MFAPRFFSPPRAVGFPAPRGLSCLAAPVLLACLAMAATPLSSRADLDVFGIDVDADNNFSPTDGGTWYKYENQWINRWFPNGGDINGWKYIEWYMTADPLPPPIVYSDAGLDLIQPIDYPHVEIAVNWSNQEWADEPGGGANGPPLPGDTGGEQFIERFILFDQELPFDGITLDSSLLPDTPPSGTDPFIRDGQLIIPDINPQWVSIDIRVNYEELLADVSGPPIALDTVNGSGRYGVSLQGEIYHVHVPEPSAFLYGGVVAAIAGLGYRRRQKSVA